MGGHWKRVEPMFAAKGEVNPYSGPKDQADVDQFQRNRNEVVARAIDVGINYIDACTAAEVLTYSKALRAIGKRDKVNLEEWLKATIEACKFQKDTGLVGLGALYGMPATLVGPILYYTKGLFAKAGVAEGDTIALPAGFR